MKLHIIFFIIIIIEYLGLFKLNNLTDMKSRLFLYLNYIQQLQVDLFHSIFVLFFPYLNTHRTPYIWNRLDQLPGRKYKFDITQINWMDIIRLTGYPMRIKWVEFRFFFVFLNVNRIILNQSENEPL